jgi:heme O synthase-like polyprenyltransferase
MQGGVNMPYPAAQYPRQSQAVVALVLSLLGIFFCCLTSLPGAILGFQEVRAIDRGEIDPSNKGLALAAGIIGAIITSIMLLFALLVLASVLFVGASAPDAVVNP